MLSRFGSNGEFDESPSKLLLPFCNRADQNMIVNWKDSISPKIEKKTRVLMVSPFHPRFVRGGTQQLSHWLFLEMLRDSNFDVYFLAGDLTAGSISAVCSQESAISKIEQATNEFLFPVLSYDHWWQRTDDVRSLKLFEEFLQALKPDVVNFHHFMNFGVELITLTRRLLPGSRIIFSFHEYLTMCAADGQLVRRHSNRECEKPEPAQCALCFPDRGIVSFQLRDLWFRSHLASVDHFVTVTDEAKLRYVNWGIPQERITVIENGLPNGQAHQEFQKNLEKPIQIAFFGQLVDAKGLGTLLDAVELLHESDELNIQVKINGDNINFASEKLRRKFENALEFEQALPNDQRILEYLGPYDRESLPARMSMASWVVIPSTWPETYCLVLSEAWAARVPVIVSDIGALGRRVEEGFNGFKFNPGDAARLVAIIRQLNRDRSIRENIAAGIRSPKSISETSSAYSMLFLATKSDFKKDLARCSSLSRTF